MKDMVICLSRNRLFCALARLSALVEQGKTSFTEEDFRAHYPYVLLQNDFLSRGTSLGHTRMYRLTDSGKTAVADAKSIGLTAASQTLRDLQEQSRKLNKRIEQYQRYQELLDSAQ